MENYKILNVNTNGNRKLRNTENTRFIIWNLPAVKTCPFRTAMCEKSCYARKAERIYPQVLPSREQNYTDSLSPDFVPNMIHTIENELNKKKYTGKLCVFRIHESGDFYNSEYTQKWVDIANHFVNDSRIVFLAYTKSIKYVIWCGFGSDSFPKNFIVRSSIWKDTVFSSRYYTKQFNFPVYTALTEKEMETEKENGRIFEKCNCDDCANCGKCWNNQYKEIICKIH
jgi:hypothetical protein